MNFTPSPWTLAPRPALYQVVPTADMPTHSEICAPFAAISVGTRSYQVAIIPCDSPNFAHDAVVLCAAKELYETSMKLMRVFDPLMSGSTPTAAVSPGQIAAALATLAFLLKRIESEAGAL